MRRTLNKAFAVALSMAMMFSAFAIAPNVNAAAKPKKITLSVAKKTLNVGGKFTLKVKKVKPAKANKKVTWKSSKKLVAAVNAKGVVSAKKAGSTKITATSKVNKKVKATCTVTVKAVSVVTPTPTIKPSTGPTPTPTATSKPTPTPFPLPADSLKDVAAFKVGTVINYDKTQNPNFTALCKQQFEVVSFENEMKGYSLLDTTGSKAGDGTPVCQFDRADEMVEWAIANGQKVRGHVLIWEASMANSFFYVDYDESKGLVDKATLLARMESYIDQVMTHFETKYPDTVIAWDVVNEAINADNSAVASANGLYLLTTGKFYQIVGEDYVKYAFQYARNTVDKLGKEINLFYNDFNCFQAPKTARISALITYLNKDKMLMDSMGMEGYVLTYWPDVSEVKKAMETFQKLGVKIGINELCVRLNPDLAAKKGEVTTSDINAHAKKYVDLMKIYKNFNATYPNTLTNVSIWALTDRPDLLENTSHYDYGVYGTHSGLFTEEYIAKDVFDKVIAALK